MKTPVLREAYSWLSALAKIDSTFRQQETRLSRYEASLRRQQQSLHRHEVFLRSQQAALRQITPPADLDEVFIPDTLPYGVGAEPYAATNRDSDYLAFENIFRGSEEQIKARQRRYLDYIKEAESHSSGVGYFLDVGSGRGEFLELLREEGIPVKGVEINGVEREALEGRGFDVFHGDGNSILAGIGNDSLLGISAFQVVEHLTSEYLGRFIELAFEKIAPGGLIILETVNQWCTFALSSFFLDPTHLRPYPPEFLNFALELRGFKDITVVFSTPCPREFRRQTPEYNYCDFAVIGRKP